MARLDRLSSSPDRARKARPRRWAIPSTRPCKMRRALMCWRNRFVQHGREDHRHIEPVDLRDFRPKGKALQTAICHAAKQQGRLEG